MKYPAFFDSIETIKVKDPLSAILGSIDQGEYEFSYLDIVKSSGHSCPTVAGAYLLALVGLKTLYPDQPVLRGGVQVEFKESEEDGVAGVIANVISQITGATDKSGFKGLQGKFARHSLLKFSTAISADQNASAKFTRLDNQQSVTLKYDSSSVTPNPEMQGLMSKMMQNSANEEELEKFGELWQDRVKRIFQNIDTVITII